ncbi:MAG: response regulator [Armatimonadota bacterium]|nr:response regulator [Armatimonadota bacterium]MDW8156528.1 response regulator [Armatimonadota bacterium]
MSRRIVIAEDEAVVRMGVRAILEDAGYRVVGEAADGQECLDLVRAHDPDLVILDVRMPPPNGIEVARRLRETSPRPVVFLTAFADRDLLEQAAAAGAFGYVVKPVVGTELLAAVELAWARWRELQDAHEALETRKLVERAKGVLMRRLGLGEEEAYRLLQRRSRNLRRPMREVAQAVLVHEEIVSQSPKPKQKTR